MSQVRQFRGEIALSTAGLLATLVAFAVEPLWGWRVLGAAMLAMAALILFIAGSAYLMPRANARYGDGKAAFAIALITTAMGLNLLLRADELAHRACRALPVLDCASVCTNADLVSVPSPTRSVRAIRYVRSCDVPAVLTTHVSIVPMGQPLGDEPGNALVVDGRADLVLLWIGGKQLAVSGAGAASPQLQKRSVNGIHVSYDEPRR